MHDGRRSRRFRDQTEGVSEIVGALLLVVIVSSAAFGFGIFLHQQQQETQRQQAAELAVKLEKVVVQGVVPDGATDPCGASPDSPAGTWTTLSFTLVSRHLHATTITQVTLDQQAVKVVTVGGDVIDLSLGAEDPSHKDLVLQPGQTIVLRLEHVSCDLASGLSPFYLPPAGGLPQTEPLDLDLVTALGNHVEGVFTPPVALASVEPLPGAGGDYALVGTSSEAGEGGFIAKWDWQYWDAAADPTCATPAGAHVSGHRYQVGPASPQPVVSGTTYCVRLVVTDNRGLTGTATTSFTA